MSVVASLGERRIAKIRDEFRRRWQRSAGEAIDISDLIGDATPGTHRYVEVIEAIALFTPPSSGAPSSGDAA